MANASLIKKLLIKAGHRGAIVNSPPGYVEGLGPLPAGAKVGDKLEAPLDFAQVFVSNSGELEKLVPPALKALKSDGLFWICYPKGGSKVKTDLNRDILRKAMEKYGQAGIAMISLDDTWSAMRFRPAEKVGK
ncbi:MAG: hypothetical protein HYX81_03920 [Chloroflexi bacterium]|nr:hypothetical protein [Chloroflexota bacterium]